MNKVCRCSLRRWALCPFVVRLSRTFFRFVTFFQNVVKSVKLFLSRGNALIGLCLPSCQALFAAFAKFLSRPASWEPTDSAWRRVLTLLHAKDGPGRFLSEHVAELVTHASSSSSLCQAAQGAFLRLWTLSVNKIFGHLVTFCR